MGKLILCCSLPNVIPNNKFHLNRMKNTEVPIFEFWHPQNFFENSAEAKLSKLEPFAWSHWIRNCLNYLHFNVNIRPIKFTKWPNFLKLSQAKIGNLVSPA